MTFNRNGIVYIIGGAKYAKWALKSIISLRRNGGRTKNLPIHVHFIDKIEFERAFKSLGCTSFIHRSNANMSHYLHRLFKSFIMQNKVPFDKYIMIDADTFVQGDFYDMFDLIPEDGIAGIEDGNFKSHLQMAKFLFLTKQADKKNARNLVKNMLGVDYGLDKKFPPYYNVGVIGFSRHSSSVIGKHLFPLLKCLSHNKFYNCHDEQLPINSIIYLKKLHAISIDPIYNYTRSRMKNNKKEGIHDNMKNKIKIIHNRHYPKEADWVNVSEITMEVDTLLRN